MTLTRRDFGKLTATGLAAVALDPKALLAQAKPNSKFNGVQIGVISYSYRQMPEETVENILKWMIEDNVNAIEYEAIQEGWAGAPKRPQMQRPAGPPAGAPPPAGGPPVAGGPPAGGAPRPGGGGRQMSPEMMAANAQYAKDLTAWRTSVPMSKYEELRKMYADKGISIYAFKAAITMEMGDAECDYIFNAAKACGANQVTMEMPDGKPELTAKIGKFADKHKMWVGYHAHLQATPTTWDEAFSQSPYNGANLDLGHFTAAGNSPEAGLAFIKKNHARITSMHLKDRKTKEHGEANMPWGEGDTPIVAALQLMKKEGYKFPATVELEYPIPAGSDSVKEVAKCVAYAKKALMA